MRRLALVALVGALGCGETVEEAPGPRDRFYLPTGIAVHDGKLLVASSNHDLRYDEDTGGTIIAVDPAQDPVPFLGALNVRSFAGQLATIDPAACGLDPASAGGAHALAQGPLALLAVRGEDLLYRARIGPDGSLSCDGCAVGLGGASFVDAFAVGVACGNGIARAYVGYLRASFGAAWLSQVDLADPSGAVQHLGEGRLGFGQVRSFAFDAPRRRLYFTRTAASSSTALGYVDLAGGCRLDLAPGEVLLDPDDPDRRIVACRTGSSVSGAIPRGLELRAVALASDGSAPGPRRAYLTARIYDAAAAAAAGTRIGDYDGLLLVVDLVEDLAGEIDVRVVRQIPIGYGASDLVVLPARAGRRDVVAALAADDGVLWIHDDDTGETVAIGRDDLGHPKVGAAPFGLAADPVATGEHARLYVGSFLDSFVTPVDVRLDDPGSVDGVLLGLPIVGEGGVAP